MEDKKKENNVVKIILLATIVILIVIISVCTYYIYINFQTKEYVENTENDINRGIIDLTKENFQTEVEESDKQVLVCFVADWCKDCQNMEPVIEEIVNETSDYAKICKVNIDDQEELKEEYEIKFIPTFILFKDGQEVIRKLGEMPKEELLQIFFDF